VPLLVPTSGTYVLTMTHPLPPTVDLEQVEAGPLAPLYRAAGWTRASRGAQTLEHLRQAPADFFGGTLADLAYTLGVAGRGAARPHPEFVPVVALYVVACLTCPAARQAQAWLIHGFVLAQLVVVALFTIGAYPPRLVLPLYGLMPAVAGLGAVALGGWLRRAMSRPEPRPTPPRAKRRAAS
jgi:hypothetical protein